MIAGRVEAMTRVEIARIIKLSRIKSGLTQKKAAEALGRKQQTLASWETGQSQPDLDTLFCLFQLYGQSIDDSFGFATHSTLTNRERELLRAYHDKPEVRRAVEILLGLEAEA